MSLKVNIISDSSCATTDDDTLYGLCVHTLTLLLEEGQNVWIYDISSLANLKTCFLILL